MGHPGSPFPHKRLLCPGCCQNFTDSFFLFPTINFLWGREFCELREWQKKTGERGTGLQTQVWTGSQWGSWRRKQESRGHTSQPAAGLQRPGPEGSALPPWPHSLVLTKQEAGCLLQHLPPSVRTQLHCFPVSL